MSSLANLNVSDITQSSELDEDNIQRTSSQSTLINYGWSNQTVLTSNPSDFSVIDVATTDNLTIVVGNAIDYQLPNGMWSQSTSPRSGLLLIFQNDTQFVDYIRIDCDTSYSTCNAGASSTFTHVEINPIGGFYVFGQYIDSHFCIKI